MTKPDIIAGNRKLTPDEFSLVLWLLEHGTETAKPLLKQLDNARVCNCCPCGCASIDFMVAGLVPDRAAPISVVSDYEWKDHKGNMLGAFIFAKNTILAGLEIWSIDGLTAADKLPNLDDLVPIGTHSKT